MDIKQEAEHIHQNLLNMNQQLEDEIQNAGEHYDAALEQYEQTGKGDASENEPLRIARQALDAARKRLDKLLARREELKNIPDISKYNSIGRVVPYSTVRFDKVVANISDTFRLYEGDFHYPEQQIISTESFVGKKLIGKTVGSHITLKNNFELTIEELY